jgi:hypothetical protein
MIPFNTVRNYLEITQTDKVRTYKSGFFNVLKQYSEENGGKTSRNGHRIYIPYTKGIGNIDIFINDGESGSQWDKFRSFLLGTYYSNGLISELNTNQGRNTENVNYITGTYTVSFKDMNGNMKTDIRKIGKLLAKNNVEYDGKPALDWYNADPIRLKKKIEASDDLMMVISDHAYDIAGMSTGRDWTSCMNIKNGTNKDYVENDIRYGTIIAYLCEASDTNIRNPYARILIKPYKLQREGYCGTDPAPIIYYPESTVYSAYAGLNGLGCGLEEICRKIQSGKGKLRPMKDLYNDTWHGNRGVVEF